MTWILAVAVGLGLALAAAMRRGQRQEGGIVYMLLVLLALLAASALGGPGMAGRAEVLLPMAVAATCSTLLIARFSRRGTTYWLGVEAAGVLAVYLFTAPNPWQLPDAFISWVLGVRHSLDAALLVCLCGGVWLAVGWTVFWISIRRSLIWALAPGAAVLAVTVINDPGQQGLGVRVFAWMILAVCLILALNIRRLTQAWGFRAEDVTSPTAVASGRLLVFGLLLAVLLPPLSSTDISGRFFHTPAPATVVVPGHGGGKGPGQGGPQEIGYTEQVIPGGPLKRSDVEVLQVSDDWGGSHYWRGIDLYRVHSGIWDSGGFAAFSRRTPAGLALPGAEGAARRLVHATVTVLSGTSSTLFWPGQPASVSQPALVDGVPSTSGPFELQEVDGAYSDTVLKTGSTYQVSGTLSLATEAQLRAATGPDPAWVASPTLDARENVGADPAVQALAQRVTTGRSNRYDQAKAIESFLRQNQRYQLAVTAPPRGTDPVSYFLFTTHIGYCEYFASAMGEMLRSLGIPSRLVNGYGPGSLVPAQDVARRQNGLPTAILHASDAHTWVEAYFPGYGWIPFEPTPDPLYPVIDRGANPAPATRPLPVVPPVVAKTQPKPAPTAQGAAPSGWLVTAPVGLGLVAITLLAVLLAAGRSAVGDLRGPWRRLLWLGRRLRVRPLRSDTPLEFGRRLAAVVPAFGTDIETLAGAYSRQCYAMPGPPEPEVSAAWRRLRRRLLPMLLLGRPG